MYYEINRVLNTAQIVQSAFVLSMSKNKLKHRDYSNIGIVSMKLFPTQYGKAQVIRTRVIIVLMKK
jgi:hypothetical protein